ncbi:MAG: response regulator [Deltaproteobacteria bacterium]|nr:response regulator [Deltaproteobacteria bacterium]MBF0523692.1 response regulator [Deltaproteobacteria bacterium]
MSDKKLVLLVDDDADMVDAVSLKLESLNYRTAKAYDGVEGWEKIKIEKPDLMILDVMMPRKDGFELCKEIKSDPKYKDITIILLTGVADHVASTSYTHMDGKTTPADDYIPKPVDLDKLMQIVQDNMKR